MDDVDVVAHLDELRPSPDEQPVVSSVYPLFVRGEPGGVRLRECEVKTHVLVPRIRPIMLGISSATCSVAGEREIMHREEPWGDCCHEGAATEVVNMMAVGIELRTLDLVPWRVDCQVYWPRPIPLQSYQ